MTCRFLDDFDIILMDLDGVIWVDGEPIRENVSVARLLASEGRLVVVTNNSTRSRRVYSRLLTGLLGVEVPPSRIVTSGYSAAKLLVRTVGRVRVYPIGEEGLIEELTLEGHEILTMSEAGDADAVIVGLDRGLSYPKLEAALKALSSGALFVATNLDHVLPSRDGLKPGAGAIVAALERASGRKIDYNAGKPEKWIIEAAYDSAGIRGKAIVIGDRVDTDAAMAVKAGLPAVIVGTGVTKSPEAVRGLRGVFYARSLEELCRDG